MQPSAESPSVLDALESNLIRGGARWIADLTEFFRDYQVDDTIFAIYAKGHTRGRGLLLSRFFAWTVLPNYQVSLFCVDEENATFGVDRLRKRMEAVSRVAEEKDLQWAWLIVLSNRELQPQVVSFVSRYDKKELGLAVASTLSGQIILSNNQVGRSIGKQLRLGKTIGGSRSRKN